MNDNMMGYSPKNLVFDEKGREKLLNGIQKLSKAVKSTLGPSGNTVLIESQHHTHGITVTKDGVTVAKSIDLLDPVENLAVRIMKEAADRTATTAGDGTTTAVVIAEAIVTQVLDRVAEYNGAVSMVEVTRELERLGDEVIADIAKESKKLTKKKMMDVASISANNDAAIGKIIAAAYNSVGGRDGVVTVANSPNDETYNQIIKGIKFDRGYSNNHFINNQEKDEVQYDDVMVLMCDTEISNIIHLTHIFEHIIKNNQRLLMIAPCTTNVVNTMALNKTKNGMNVCIVDPPSFGWKKQELMSDIAMSIGATYFSEKTGDDLSHITIDDLGHASKIIVSKSDTIIMSDKDKDDAIKERVIELRAQYDNAKKKSDKEFLMSRIASLTGGIGIIHVGGATDLEQKERYDRVDDAVWAVRSALLEGIVAGGGCTLSNIAFKSAGKWTADGEKGIASKAMCAALVTPALQIMENAGVAADKLDGRVQDSIMGKGYDMKTGAYGDMIEMGIIDPAKVTKTALKNAVSVACTILSTNAIVTLARTYEAD